MNEFDLKLHGFELESSHVEGTGARSVSLIAVTCLEEYAAPLESLFTAGDHSNVSASSITSFFFWDVLLWLQVTEPSYTSDQLENLKSLFCL